MTGLSYSRSFVVCVLSDFQVQVRVQQSATTPGRIAARNGPIGSWVMGQQVIWLLITGL